MIFEDFLNALIMGEFTVYRKQVKNHKTSACVYLPKDLIGKEVIIIVKDEKPRTEESK